MITKTLLFCGILGAATFFSNASFAYHYSHHHRPRIHYNHHHYNSWRNVHRWEPRRNHIIVSARNPYPNMHQHY